MGGDFAPLEIVLGALEAVRETEHIDVVLVGDKTQIFKILEDNNETNKSSHFCVSCESSNRNG